MSEKIHISLTRYAESNALLHEALVAISKQKNIIAHVLMLDQQDDEETRTLCGNISSGRITIEYIVIAPEGLSRARNKAIELCQGDILLFMDPDAVPDPYWAWNLTQTLLKDNVSIAGGKIIPRWHKRQPAICMSLLVKEQFSLLDRGTEEIHIPRVVGASFGINKSANKDHFYFDEKLGRRKGSLLGGEESDLCARIKKIGGLIMYIGAAVVEHQILPERLTWKWIIRRFYAAGLGRAIGGGAPNPGQKLQFLDYLVMPVILPGYALGFFVGRASRFRIK
jgi:GT2 family glycosyltransferase